MNLTRYKAKFRSYWSLIKSLQTVLLLITGLAGYSSARCPVFHIQTLLALTGSLFLAISGSTALNMWFDRDIDTKMVRTKSRPLPSGQVSSQEGLILGLSLSIIGVGWSLWIDLFYGAIVFAGIFFDVVVYTIWLKRRSAWAIIWGGISGGMPILAGRVLGTGSLDWIGIALAFAILFWIPTHIMTYSMRYHHDYGQAGIPTFPRKYGFQKTRVIIAISCVMAAVMMGTAAFGIGMAWGFLRLFGLLSGGMLVLAVISAIKPSEQINFGLFKYASLYMLGAMVLVFITGI